MNSETVHHIVKDAFHEMVAGIQKQPMNYGGGLFQPGGRTKKKKASTIPYSYGGFQPGGYTKKKKSPPKPKTTEDKAKDIASQVSMQTGGSTTGGVKTKEGSRKLDAITQQAGSAGATMSGARASTAAGRSIQRQEKLRQNLQDPDFRAETKRTADSRGVSYDSQVKEMKQTAKDPDKMRNIYDQKTSAQGGYMRPEDVRAPVMDRTGGHFGGDKPKKGKTEPPRLPKFEDPKKPDKKKIETEVAEVTESIPKKFTPKPPKQKKPGSGGAELSDYERATGKIKGPSRLYGAVKWQAEGKRPPTSGGAGTSGPPAKSKTGGGGWRPFKSGGLPWAKKAVPSNIVINKLLGREHA